MSDAYPPLRAMPAGSSALRRCCCNTVMMDAPNPPPEDYDVPCRWCTHILIFREGRWQVVDELDECLKREVKDMRRELASIRESVPSLGLTSEHFTPSSAIHCHHCSKQGGFVDMSPSGLSVYVCSNGHHSFVNHAKDLEQ